MLDEIVDIFQVGTRNMYNYELLKELSLQKKPVVLKRGFSATAEEWILAAKYISPAPVILCERGIRSFDKVLRNTLDLAMASYLQQTQSCPVWVDPSHATGKQSLVTPMANAAVAAGLDGLMIEVHPSPKDALSDKEQALDLPMLEALSKSVFCLREGFCGK
jgi:3-deoxy-7-phosphoheptulonate synthase